MGLFILTNLNIVNNLLIKQKNISCIVKIKLYLCTTNLINIMNTIKSEAEQRNALKQAYLKNFEGANEGLSNIFKVLPIGLLQDLSKGLTRTLELHRLSILINDFINESSTLELDGETTQSLVDALHMQEQLFKQYITSVFEPSTTLDYLIQQEEELGRKGINHRLKMIQDDVNELRHQINLVSINIPSGSLDNINTCLNNIEIATELKNPESLEWGLYSHGR